MLNRIEYLRRLRRPGSEALCRAGIYELLVKIAENSSEEALPVRANAVIRTALAYMEANLWDSELDIACLAEVAGISTVYFRKLFTTAYHVPPMRYIRSLRIDKLVNYFRETIHR
ncbi:MAG: hypothetical protein ACOX17_08120 [Christensenellales bacterium]|jgi:transcriptional regulator GlxA family with amidase domain